LSDAWELRQKETERFYILAVVERNAQSVTFIKMDVTVVMNAKEGYFMHRKEKHVLFMDVPCRSIDMLPVGVARKSLVLFGRKHEISNFQRKDLNDRSWKGYVI